MNRSSVVSLSLVVLSISALVVAATTLDTTLTTDPQDEINPDWDRLPIGQGDAATIREEIEGGDEIDETDETESTDVSEGTGERDQQDRQSGSGSGTGASSSELPLLDRLLALLAVILRTLAPLLVAAVLGTLAYRYRELLRSLFVPPDATTGEAASTEKPWPETGPRSVVDRAWLTMMQHVDPDSPETTTADECRRLARKREIDVEAVDSIATAFERVHYGGVPVTEEEERARDGLRRLKREDE